MKKNNLIAEFMGLDTSADTTLRYHNNWNKLMDVVQKIECIGYNVVIERMSCHVYPIGKEQKYENVISCYVCIDISKKIDVVYESVKDFIRWHNSQSTN